MRITMYNFALLVILVCIFYETMSLKLRRPDKWRELPPFSQKDNTDVQKGIVQLDDEGYPM